MLDLKLLQKNPEVVAAALAKRHSPLNMRTFEELDNKRRELLAQVEALKAERNRASAEVARLKRNGEDAEAFIGQPFRSFFPHQRAGQRHRSGEGRSRGLDAYRAEYPGTPPFPTAWTRTTMWKCTAGVRRASLISK